MDELDRRRARRDFIRTHHPDRGGDPEEFRAGLEHFDDDPLPSPRVVVVARRTWRHALVQMVTRRRRTRAPRVQ